MSATLQDIDPQAALAFASGLVDLTAKHFPDASHQQQVLEDCLEEFLSNSGCEIDLAVLRVVNPVMASVLDTLGYDEDGDAEFDMDEADEDDCGFDEELEDFDDEDDDDI